MSWNIICDSSCDINELKTCREDILFSVVPLKIIVGETEYIDDWDLDVAKMLDHMKTFKGPSSSACPSPQELNIRSKKQKKIIFWVCNTTALLRIMIPSAFI